MSDSIIFLTITLITILIPVFVFAVSLLGRAIEKSSEEAKTKENNLKIKVSETSKKLKEASDKIRETTKTDQLEKEIRNYKKDIKKYEKEIKSIRRIPEHLTVGGCIIKPGICFLIAFLLSNIVKSSPNITFKSVHISLIPLNIISLILVLLGFLILYQCLKVIQEISLTTEQAQLQRTIDAFETALQQHEERKLPKLDLFFKDKKPPFIFNKASKNSISCSIYLKYGDVASDCEVRFLFPEAFKCLRLRTISSDEPGYIEVINEFGNLKKGLQHPVNLEIETPNVTGKFTVKYYLFCEGFSSNPENFEIEVI
jgi:hypothetical protein